jgi:hypothetical protein
MQHVHKPIVFTILFGVFCGLVFLPIMRVATSVLPWIFAFRLMLWGYLTCYACGLALWNKANARLAIVPLCLLLGMSVLEQSHSVFWLLYLGMFAVIRSSLLQPSLPRMLASEAILSLGGGILIYGIHPETNLAWALGIWMFFLIQSLYFAGWDGNHEAIEHREDDLFERAYRQAEEILSTR